MARLIVCSSKEHGNTKKLADALAEQLDAAVVEPEEVDLSTFSGLELVGFGSGIRYGRHYQPLFDLVDRLPAQPNKAAFLFSTSGFGWQWWHGALRKRLLEKGFEIRGEICCKALDTMGPLRWFGGVNKGRPDDRDLADAGKAARRLLDHASASG